MSGAARDSSDDLEIRRRQFIAIATADYEGAWDPLGAVLDEVHAFRMWLCDEQLAARRLTPIYPELAADPSYDQIDKALRQDFEPTEADVVGILIAGHGVEEHGQHHLVLKETNRNELGKSALPTAQLLGWLGSRVEHAFIVIDACHAGLIERHITERSKALPQDWVILPSAAKDQEAELGALTSAVTSFLRELKSDEGAKFSTGPYLLIDEFVGYLNEQLGLTQQIRAIGTGSLHRPHFCLPNPHYVPLLREMALPTRDLEDHWRLRGRGIESTEESGWYYTERRALLQALIERLQAPAGATVVTGGAGSGKSAALARLVTLRDPGFAEHQDAPGDAVSGAGFVDDLVDVAVYAKGKISTEVLAQILRACNVAMPKDDPITNSVSRALEHWHHWLRGYDGLLTVVVDALEEAGSPVDLLNLLAQLDLDPPDQKLRLIIGVRSTGSNDDPAALGDSPDGASAELADQVQTRLAAVALHVDRPPLWDSADITTYIARILHSTRDSPYRDLDVRELSVAVAAWAGKSFLLAHEAAVWLARGSEALTADALPPESISGRKLIDLIKANLDRYFKDDLLERTGAIMLLRTLAYGRGQGLPWRQLWPRLATALDEGHNGRIYGDRDVVALLQSGVAGYLNADREAEVPTYRLFHDELRKALRDHWRDLLPDEAQDQTGAFTGATAPAETEARDTEAVIVDELHQMVRAALQPGSRRKIDAYIRRHLAEHAVAADKFDQTYVPSDFLPYADPVRLQAAATLAGGSAAQNLPLLRVIRRVAHLWDWDEPEFNGAAIQMWAALQGITGAAVGRTPWRIIWAKGPADHGYVLGRTGTDVWAVDTINLPGQGTVAITGGLSVPQIWLLEGGTGSTRLAGPGHEGAIDALAVAELRNGRRVVVTGGDDASVRIWDLTDRRPIGQPLVGHERKVVSVATTTLDDGTVVAVTGSADRTVRVWDLDSGSCLGDPMVGHSGTVSAIAIGVLSDRTTVAVTGSADETIRVWDLARRTPIGAPLRGHTGTVAAIALVPSPQGLVAVSGVRDAEARVKDRKLRRWNLDFPKSRLPVTSVPAGVLSMSAVVLPANRVGIVTGHEDAVIRVTDAMTGEEIHPPMRGHEGTVPALTTTTTGTGPMIVSGGNYGTVRAWELDDVHSGARDESVIGAVEAVALSTAPGIGPVILLSNASNEIEQWGVLAGTPVGHRFSGASASIQAITVGALGDRMCLVAGCWDATVLLWDFQTGEMLHQPLRGHRGPVDVVKLFTSADGEPVLITAGRDGVRRWDPSSGAQRAQLYAASARSIASLALTSDGSRAVIGHPDGRLTVHDFATGRRREVDSPPGNRIAFLQTVAVPGRSDLVAFADTTGHVGTVDPDTARKAGQSFDCGPAALTSLSSTVLADGTPVLLTGDADPAVRCWDAFSGEPIGVPLAMPLPARAMAVQPGDPPTLVISGQGIAVAQMLHTTA